MESDHALVLCFGVQFDRSVQSTSSDIARTYNVATKQREWLTINTIRTATEHTTLDGKPPLELWVDDSDASCGLETILIDGSNAEYTRI